MQVDHDLRDGAVKWMEDCRCPRGVWFIVDFTNKTAEGTEPACCHTSHVTAVECTMAFRAVCLACLATRRKFGFMVYHGAAIRVGDSTFEQEGRSTRDALFLVPK